jgi:hypothetical protein
MLDTFMGSELKAEDISGVCFIGEVSVGAIAVSGSATAMLLGIPPIHVTKELAINAAFQGIPAPLVEKLTDNIEILKSSAKAILYMGGIDFGYDASISLMGSIGYIREGKYIDVPVPIVKMPSSVESTSMNGSNTAKIGKIILAGNIPFECGEHAVKPWATPILVTAATLLFTTRNRRIVITGYRDNTERKSLAKKRAQAVWGWLLGYGVNVSKAIIQERGPDNPIRKKNRRVEIWLMPD